jgi:hypothetical protein
MLGGLAACLSNTFADDGSRAEKPGAANTAFGVVVCVSLIMVCSPWQHVLLLTSPFYVGALVSSSTAAATSNVQSLISKLSVFAPHALAMFSTDFLLEQLSAADSAADRTPKRLLVLFATLIAITDAHTKLAGLTIVAAAIASTVPAYVTFAADAGFISTPLCALLAAFSFSCLATLVFTAKHSNGPLVVRPSLPTTLSFSLATLSSLHVALSLSDVGAADASFAQGRNPTLVLFQLYAGAAAAIMMTAFASAVNEIWYPVGSSQVQMVAWDTFGLLFYFVAPLSILSTMAWTKYDVAAKLVAAGWSGSNPHAAVSAMTVCIAVLVSVALPMLNIHSLFNSSWFAKVYTHGQPNSGNASISVDFGDLFNTRSALKSTKENSGDDIAMDREHEKLWAACKKHSARLTIFVTKSDLTRFASIVAELAQAHHVGISVDCSVRDKWDDIAAAVDDCAELYEKVVGKKPWWLRGGGGGRHPSLLTAANARGINVAFWSTYAEIGAAGAQKALDVVMEDVEKTAGGNIVYLRLGSCEPAAAGETLAKDLVLVLNGLEGVCYVKGLDAVVKPDHAFNLD